MIERQEVEALLAACEPGSETFVEAMDKLSRRKVAALCRAWLAVDGAPAVALEWGDFNRGLHIDDDRMTPYAWETHLTGQRVRIVKEVGDD